MSLCFATRRTHAALFLLIVLLLVGFACRSKSVVKRLGKVDSKSETTSINGSIYHLPLTVIRVAVPMTAIKYTPGVYNDLTPCFYDQEAADGRIKAASTEISLGAPGFSSYGKADLDETFVVKTTGGFFESRTIAMKYGRDGVLTDGLVESVDETLPTVLKIGEMVAGIGVKVAARRTSGTPGSGTLSTAAANADPIAASRSAFEGRVSCYLQGFDYAARKLRGQLGALNIQLADTSAASQPANVHDAIRKNIAAVAVAADNADKRLAAATRLIRNLANMSEEERNFHPFVINLEKANKAYLELEELQKTREAAEANITNVSPEVYAIRLTEIDEQIKPLADSFFGSQATYGWEGDFEINLSKTTFNEASTLLVYSPAGGVCYNGPYKMGLATQGILVPIEFQNVNCPSDGRGLVKIQLLSSRRSEDADFIAKVDMARRSQGNDRTSGWYFRIPAKATVAVAACPATESRPCTLSDTEYGRSEMIIAQYGAVVSMPAQTSGRSSATSISLDETTGALKNFRMGSGPVIDRSTITETGKAIQSTLDATDPLTKKKRELELLKIQNDINDQRKKLGIPAPTPQ